MGPFVDNYKILNRDGTPYYNELQKRMLVEVVECDGTRSVGWISNLDDEEYIGLAQQRIEYGLFLEIHVTREDITTIYILRED